MGAFISLLPYVFHHYFDDPTKESIKNKYNRLHFKCRNNDPHNINFTYQSNMDSKKGELVYRAYIPDDKVSWSNSWVDYKPVEFTSSNVLAKPVWADPEDIGSIKWNTIDNNIDRRSHLGKYGFDEKNGRPLNPKGRTGISGRGQLGKWGPNHAADPIVTRWKRNEDNVIVYNRLTYLPILQFASICRKDTKQWAIPGGMCDPGEKVSVTLKREFMEEATASIEQSDESRKKISDHLDSLFENGNEIYKGYVDDPRNTDNAWMETTAYNFHDQDNKIFKEFKLQAGDDAGAVKWMDISSELNLYASHTDFIEETARLHNAHW